MRQSPRVSESRTWSGPAGAAGNAINRVSLASGPVSLNAPALTQSPCWSTCTSIPPSSVAGALTCASALAPVRPSDASQLPALRPIQANV